jgi:hypothetical protein
VPSAGIDGLVWLHEEDGTIQFRWHGGGVRSIVPNESSALEHPVLVRVPIHRVLGLDASITRRKFRAIFASVVVETVADATVGLVLVLSGAVATTIQGWRAWWRHTTILACEAVCALAGAAVGGVHILGGAMAIAITEGITGRRQCARVAAVAVRTLALTAICCINICRRAMTAAIRGGNAGGRDATVASREATMTAAVTAIGLVEVAGGAMATAINCSNAKHGSWRGSGSGCGRSRLAPI